jgi:hypothetical protein
VSLRQIRGTVSWPAFQGCAKAKADDHHLDVVTEQDRGLGLAKLVAVDLCGSARASRSLRTIGGAAKIAGLRPSPWRIAATISPTVNASMSATISGRRSGAGVFSTASIASNKFSSASSERRALMLRAMETETAKSH